ncbi:MAG: hypothetical protein AB8G95_02075 [Anaerolineae bacterium]
MFIRSKFSIFLLFSGTLLGIIFAKYPNSLTASAPPTTPHPIMFVTQVPIAADFTTIGSTFGNHLGTLNSVGRGGDLYIRYPDGTLKNLTAAAGYGGDGFLSGEVDNEAIAVRDPAVHWDGEKAVFSMVVGVTEDRYVHKQYRWQLYEITGLALADTPVITKVPNQPADFNNISPIYGSFDQIIFTSDRPRDGQPHLYPQRDEYESAPTNTGIWSLNPATGEMFLLNHAPSGDFSPMIDSNGQVIFTQWDHLQRDQQADADALTADQTNTPYGSFNYSDEGANATLINDRTELFPEPRGDRTDLLTGTNMNGHRFNHFFPWVINQDGTESEILLHLGRHELHNYINSAINDDPNVVEFYNQYPRTNPNSIENMFHIEEDPTVAQSYYGVDAAEFGTHSAGYIINIATAGKNADQVIVNYVTQPRVGTGSYREPLPLSNGSLIAVYAPQSDYESGSGFDSDYAFRLHTLVDDGNGLGHMTAGEPLTEGISKAVSYWDPDNIDSFDGVMWELNPVEVKARTRPVAPTSVLKAPEQQVFDNAGVSIAAMQTYLKQQNLALIITRDVTTRDDLDLQQPFNLKVAGSPTQSIGSDGKVYDVSHMQFFQGEQIRGYGYNRDTPREGRRVIAQPMPMGINPSSNGPESSVVIAADGSMAAFVPAQRALSWQLTAPSGEPVVRERYWLTFQPGEIRSCGSCHGVSDRNQVGEGEPENAPQALADLLVYWQQFQDLEEQTFLPAVSR